MAAVTIIAGQNASAGVVLLLIGDGDEPGRFEWVIWPIDSGANLDYPDLGIISFPNLDIAPPGIPPGTTSWADSVNLPPGQYYVIFTLQRQFGAGDGDMETARNQGNTSHQRRLLDVPMGNPNYSSAPWFRYLAGGKFVTMLQGVLPIS